MKKLLFAFVALVLLAGVASAQPNVLTTTALNTTYASTIDTSGVVNISPVGRVSVFVSAADSAELAINVDYRGSGAQNWVTMTAAAGDTLITTSNSGAGLGLELRDNSATNRIPGGAQIRFRVDGVSNLGVTSPNYTVLVFTERP